MIVRWRTPRVGMSEAVSRKRPGQLPESRGIQEITDAVRRRAIAVLKGTIRLYQLTLSPLVGGQCRFHPTCSNYALEAIARHGPIAGSSMALKRLLKCHPFHPGGLDLPPGSGG